MHRGDARRTARVAFLFEAGVKSLPMKPEDHVARIRAQFTRQANAYAETEQARDERAMSALAKLSGGLPAHRAPAIHRFRNGHPFSSRGTASSEQAPIGIEAGSRTPRNGKAGS
jgi:hypothetical protein